MRLILTLTSNQMMKIPNTQSAGFILFRWAEPTDTELKREALMVQQHGQSWSFPKGHREGDETLLQCAFRELREETGIRGQLLVDSDSWTYTRESIAGKKEMKEITLFYALPMTEEQEVGELHSDDDTITAIEWVDTLDVCDRLHAEEDKTVWREILSVKG